MRGLAKVVKRRPCQGDGLCCGEMVSYFILKVDRWKKIDRLKNSNLVQTIILQKLFIQGGIV